MPVSSVGDADFDQYVAATGSRMLRLAYLLTGNPHDAEDLLQEVLAKVYVRWTKVCLVEHREAYIRQIMVNTNRRRHRARRFRQLSHDLLPDRGDLAPGFGAVDDRSALGPALSSLTAKQRAVVVLRYCEDLSEEEVAATLGCSVGTVKSQAAKSVRKMRAQLSIESPALARSGGARDG